VATGLESSEHLITNALGHATGVLIFGHFLGLSVWNQPANRPRANRLAILAAALALLWNLASLAVLLIGEKNPSPAQLVATVGFCALSLLPAVLLHLCLAGSFPLMVRFGYVLSALSIAAHLAELLNQVAPYHRVGLAMITAGFGILTVVSVVRILWSANDHARVPGSRLLAGMSLFLFAISFVHFSEGQAQHAWSTELIFHHAGIPLALIVLLQDHRFIFVDTFIRLLAKGGVAGVLAFALAAASTQLNFVGQALVGGALLVTFGKVSGLVQHLLTRLVFRQKEPSTLIRDLQSLALHASDEVSYVGEASRQVARFMNADVIDCPQIQGELNLLLPSLVTDAPGSRELQRYGVQVVFPIRLRHGTTRNIFLGKRAGGRRYLSEDLQTLAHAAARLAQDADRIRETERLRLFAQAELCALQAQINPHFLFNALNAIYGIIPREVKEARRMLLHLADVFRYFLQSDRTYIPLEEEIRIVKAYLAIEQLRLGDKLRVEIEVDDSALRDSIPVLSVQPLVENAIKHGIAAHSEGGQVRIEVKRKDGALRVVVSDTGPGFSTEGPPPGGQCRTGVGLENVTRRLQLCYGLNARVEIENGPGRTNVSFLVPCQTAVGL
jgi:signal transduction histidine kinase